LSNTDTLSTGVPKTRRIANRGFFLHISVGNRRNRA
jgi:hypothetical protein